MIADRSAERVQKHIRFVYQAAKRAARCDELGLCDDWVLGYLRFVRRDARFALPQALIDEWTMAGCLAGRKEG